MAVIERPRLLQCLLAALLIMAARHVPAAIVIDDAEGRRLELEKPASRIVALAPHVVENLFAIGAGDSLVGVSAFSDYPAPARQLPRVGGVGSLSVEQITALEPDLVIVWGSGTAAAVRKTLERIGIPVLVDEIRSLDDLRTSFLRLGEATGHANGAVGAVRQIDSALASTRSQAGAVASHEHDQPRVLLQIWDSPLQSIGRDHLLTEVIGRCGAQSLSGQMPGLAPIISLEQVLAADPALIIVESEAQGQHWQRWPQLRAVRDDNVVVIDPDLLHRPTLRLLDGMAEICRRVTGLRDDAAAAALVNP